MVHTSVSVIRVLVNSLRERDERERESSCVCVCVYVCVCVCVCVCVFGLFHFTLNVSADCLRVKVLSTLHSTPPNERLSCLSPCHCSTTPSASYSVAERPRSILRCKKQLAQQCLSVRRLFVAGLTESHQRHAGLTEDGRHPLIATGSRPGQSPSNFISKGEGGGKGEAGEGVHPKRCGMVMQRGGIHQRCVGGRGGKRERGGHQRVCVCEWGVI